MPRNKSALVRTVSSSSSWPIRFRLRTLLLFVTLACLYLGYETMKVRSELPQEKLVQDLRQEVGPPMRTSHTKRWSIVSWLITGKSTYWYPIGVEIYGGQATDESIALLQQLSCLRKLKISGDNVTDAGIENIIHLTNLQEMDLTETTISSSGIERLQRALPNCQVSR